jgi:hypothetical protein
MMDLTVDKVTIHMYVTVLFTYSYHNHEALVKPCFFTLQLATEVAGSVTDYKHATSRTHILGSLIISMLDLPYCFGGSSNYDNVISVICLLANGSILKAQTLSLSFGM